MTRREVDLNVETAIRSDVIEEMLSSDGIPPDGVTAVALMSLGIRMHHDILQDKERLAHILEQWADGVRNGRYIGKMVIKPKDKKT